MSVVWLSMEDGEKSGGNHVQPSLVSMGCVGEPRASFGQGCRRHMHKGTLSGPKARVSVPWVTTACSQKQGSIKLIELSEVI